MDKEAVVKHIVNWIKNYVHTSKVQGLVVGVSGGVDSALTSKLCALTGLPVLCLEMPIYQSKDQVNRALKHIQNLMELHPNVEMQSVNLTPVFDAFLKAVPEDKAHRELALANTRARIRMTCLYYFAQMRNSIVVGTGNKVEDFGIGFFTKYGDGGVDISPIADLLKTEVYELAEYLNIIPEILQAPPTDGLWGDDRTDEDQIGASYPELEWAMQQYEEGKKPEDFKGREREVMEIYIKLHTANLHKMIPIPVCKIPESLKN
ncbi:MAG: NAD(+) synthase [Bacteroidetes bacterium]|nr:MAG: NAD(+) synthase [Bacteroidota bacterium]